MSCRPRCVLAACWGALLAAGCSVTQPVIATSTAPRTASHLYISRSFKVVPEPDPFVQGVIVAFTEELVLAGYDFTGVTSDPDDEDALLGHLAKLNERIPGTVGIHLVFVETPVDMGTTYFPIDCTVYDSRGQIVLQGEIDPPERPIRKLLFSQPEVDGRLWAREAWDQTLSYFFPRRG